MTTQWQELEREFRQVHDVHSRLKVSRQYCDDEAPGPWIIGGNLDEPHRDRFEVTARLAGKELLADSAIRSQLPDEVIREKDDLQRWLIANQVMTANHRVSEMPYEKFGDLEDEVLFILITEHIDGPVESSRTLCRQLAAFKHAASALAVAIPTTPRPRLELDENRKRLRIDNEWHDYTGEKATYLLAVLLKVRGQWEVGGHLEDPSVVIPRADKIIRRLPKEITDLIQTRKGGRLSGGYRIKPEYFD